MPRDSGTGVYTLPPSFSDIQAGLNVSSSPVRESFVDMSAALNQALPAGLLPALNYLPLSGGTLTGAVVLSGNGTANLNPVTLQQQTTALALKSDTGHTHVAATITDFNTAADARIAAAVINTLADVASTSPVAGHILVWDGTNYANRAPYVESNLGGLDTLGTNTTKKTYTHGLGARPSRVDVFARCKTASFGFVVGDETLLNKTLTGGLTVGADWYWNATTVVVSGYGFYYVIHPNGTNDYLVTSSFDLIVRAYR